MTSEKMTSRHPRNGLNSALRMLAGSLLLSGALALSGCSPVPFGKEEGAPAPGPATTAPAVDGAVAEPEASKPPAEEFSAKLSESLGALAATTKAPNREQMNAAMVAAGADPKKVEVSIDITPTGLAVDAIEAATLIDTECVVGQVREGSVAVTILPVLESGRCFIGDVN